MSGPIFNDLGSMSDRFLVDSGPNFRRFVGRILLSILIDFWWIGPAGQQGSRTAGQQDSRTATQQPHTTRPGGMREAIKFAVPHRGAGVCWILIGSLSQIHAEYRFELRSGGLRFPPVWRFLASGAAFFDFRAILSGRKGHPKLTLLPEAPRTTFFSVRSSKMAPKY